MGEKYMTFYSEMRGRWIVGKPSEPSICEAYKESDARMIIEALDKQNNYLEGV